MPTIAENEIFDIVASLYEAANRSEMKAWLDVYLRMERLFDSGHGGIFIYDKAADEFSEFIGTTPDWVYREYVDRFQYICPFREHSFALKAGEYVKRSDLLPDEEFKALPIYRDYYEPAETLHFVYLVFIRTDGRMGGLSFTRPASKPDFSDNEIRTMLFMLPHLERAFNFYLGNLESQIHTSLMQDTFDRLPQGVLLIDENLKIIYANRAAENLVHEGDCLMLGRNGELTATKLENDRKLRKSIRSVIRSEEKAEVSIALSHNDGRRDLEVSIASFSDHKILVENPGRFAVLYLNDPDGIAPIRDEHLVQLYGFTNAEARITSMLCEGKSVSEICDELSIAENTCRTHIKRIFSKTDTNKQSELISLIISGSGHARRTD